MSSAFQEEIFNERQDRLLTMLEHLLEVPTSASLFVLDQVVRQVQEVLSADLVALFFHEPAIETLVVLSSSDSPLGKQQRAIGMDRLPLANGGSTVEVFLSGIALFNNHVDQDPNELLGIKGGLGVKSQMATVFKVQTQHRGVLLVASTKPDFFLPGDLRFLEVIARWVGLMVGRNELAEQMEQKNIEHDQEGVAKELLTMMIHELRNYLQPLRGRLDLLTERARREGREKDRHDAESGLHTLEMLTRGISDILDIARLTQGVFAITPVPMNITQMVQDVVATFAHRPILFTVQAPGQVILRADPQRVQQAFETMLLYMLSSPAQPEEVTIDISTEIRIDGPWALLSIRANGLAMPHISSDLLQPFVVNVPSLQLGVQLYLAGQIARAHGGTLMIHSTDDQETQFTLALPVEEEELIVSGGNENTDTQN
ncbi:hypothetical protein KDH_60560 [Dictyobacter sp. S3.2.2.5]|uniref:histidine kinase n=1 Tax=Dictyobacter halimunensis TaxID=3026934 RepID=A0ABQ6G3L6_9CHLR|nr:hypothetical protein KDH_60560 [Dictyobacter sp. S3.2.2.5]